MKLTLSPIEIGLGNDFVSRLNDIAWRLRNGEVIEYDFDTVKMLEMASEELDEYRNYEYSYDEVLDLVWESLDEDGVKKLVKDIRHELNITKRINKEATKEDCMDQVIEWYSMSIDDLKRELKDKDLKISGTKEILVNRLKEDWLERNDL